MTEPTPAAGQPAAPATGAPAQPDSAVLQREIETLRSQLTDRERAAEFWFEKANTAAPPAAASAPTKAEAEEEVDILELITTKGAQGLDDYLEKKGFITKEAAEALADAKVNSKASQIATEGQLMQQYPELADDQSEFFKQTALEYHSLKNQGIPENMAMKLAAERVELSGLKSGKIKTPQERGAAQREQERLARISAQSGDRGGRRSETIDDENDTEITDAERKSIEGMLVGEPHPQTGKRMSYEDAVEVYRSRAKAGVRVSSRSRR